MKCKKIGTILSAMLLSVNLASCTMDTGERDYEKGVQAYADGEYGKAAEYFTSALEKNGDRAEYYLYYGFALMELGEYIDAAKNFEKVIQDKEIDTVRENNKRAYRGAGIAYYMAGEYAKALEDFYAALQFAGLQDLDEDIRTYMMQANAKQLETYRAAGELGQALAACGRLLEEYGASADLYRIRADIFMEQMDYESALSDFDLAIGAGDTQMGTLLGKLQALQALGREEGMREVSAQIAGMSPENDGERLAAAVALFVLGEYEPAGTAFMELYRKNIKEAGYYLAQVAMINEDYSAALKYLDEWEAGCVDFTGEANLAELYYQIAFCCLEEGQAARAEEYCEKLGGLKDESYRAKQEKLHIVILEHQGKWKEALALLEQYMENEIKEGDAGWDEAVRELAFLKSR